MQLDLLARLLRFESLDHRLGACGVTLVGALPPRREGHADQHADVVHARKLLLETVVGVRIRDKVVGRQCDGGQHLGQCDLLLFAVNLRGQLETLQLGAMAECLLGVGLFRGGLNGKLLDAFVNQQGRMLHVEPAELRQEHTRERQPVVHLRLRHLGLVELHFDRQFVRLRGHAGRDHGGDVGVHLAKQIDVGVGQLFLVSQRDDLPIGLVRAADHVLQLRVVHRLGQLAGVTRDLVVRDDLPTHEYGLHERHITDPNVLHIHMREVLQLFHHLGE